MQEGHISLQMLKKFYLKFSLVLKRVFGTADALILLTHNLQTSLNKRAESRGISFDFSSAFDLVNHQALLFKLRLIGIGGPLFNVFK